MIVSEPRRSWMQDRGRRNLEPNPGRRILRPDSWSSRRSHFSIYPWSSGLGGQSTEHEATYRTGIQIHAKHLLILPKQQAPTMGRENKVETVQCQPWFEELAFETLVQGGKITPTLANDQKTLIRDVTMGCPYFSANGSSYTHLHLKIQTKGSHDCGTYVWSWMLWIWRLWMLNQFCGCGQHSLFFNCP